MVSKYWVPSESNAAAEFAVFTGAARILGRQRSGWSNGLRGHPTHDAELCEVGASAIDPLAFRLDYLQTRLAIAQSTLVVDVHHGFFERHNLQRAAVPRAHDLERHQHHTHHLRGAGVYFADRSVVFWGRDLSLGSLGCRHIHIGRCLGIGAR